MRLRRGFLAGVAVCGAGMVASSLTPSVGVACATFLVTGIGAGLVLVHQRILVHALIAESMLARAFGVLDSVTSWAYAIAYIGGGVLAVALGARGLFLVAGAALLVLAVASGRVLSSALDGAGTRRERTGDALAWPLNP
jgi:MFS family permease